MKAGENKEQGNHSVGLFVTCLVDLLRPQIGFAAARLLENYRCAVIVPPQSCCGQPAYNSGDEKSAMDLARRNIVIFQNFDYVVAPSGSCVSMIKEHYPKLLHHDSRWKSRARDVSGKTFELSQFLVDVLKIDMDKIPSSSSGEKKVTYHDSCSGLRELGIRSQPRKLLKNMLGIEIRELNNSETCCGFGGAFCMKFPQISASMADDKISAIESIDADVLLGGDLGCLMNISGRLSKIGKSVKVMHYAELLAGQGPAQPL